MIRTAESVAMGHPDKICDQIADAILDECLAHDPRTRSAIEVIGGHGKLFITGELSTRAPVGAEEIADIARRVYGECGGDGELEVAVHVAEQSPEIAGGVDNDGAGDQGIMVGYATAETDELMPIEVSLARTLTDAMGARDGKSQVTVNERGEVTGFLTSVCGEYPDALHEAAETHIAPRLARGCTLEEAWTKNPNGEWTIGGFAADSGLTGRKIVVDAYGPNVPVGGGAFSGKDATKVDRSGAYMARKVAADAVRAGAREALVRIAYAIGQAEPVAAVIVRDGGEPEPVRGYDLRPRAIIEALSLEEPGFLRTARFGHFGRGYAWD